MSATAKKPTAKTKAAATPTTSVPARLKLPSRAKPSKAVSADLTRPALTCAYVVQVNGHRELLASNSYILARVRVPDDIPTGPIQLDALKEIEKGTKHEVKDGAVEVTLRNGSVVRYEQPYGAAQKTFGMLDTLIEFDPKDCDVLEIGLNPTLLKNLADAIGAGDGAVKIEVPVRDGQQVLEGMRVTPLNRHSESEGLLMPVRLNQ